MAKSVSVPVVKETIPASVAMQRTKIVATVGPACDSYDQLLALPWLMQV